MPPPNPRLALLPDRRLQIKAPAKINLGLRVFPPRPDGYHDIESWFVPLSWHDTLTITPGAPRHPPGPLQLRITGRTENIPTDLHENLIGKAALKLAAAAKIQPAGTVELHKILPPGGGLGGGSSDAASALLALNHVWNLGWEDTMLANLAAELGSDVPFFIHARPALCTGRGEIMSPLRPAYPLFALLILPTQGCPTKQVFQAFDAGHRHSAAEKTDWSLLANSRAEQLNELLQNDLAPAAFHIAPWLAQLQKQARQIANRPIHLTGSGSTLFTLCNSSQQAADLQSLLTPALDPSAATLLPTQILLQAN